MHHRENNHHTLMMKWPAIQKTWKLHIIPETLGGMILSVFTSNSFSHFEGGDLCSFIKAVQCFYERPGFCLSMLRGENVTKMKYHNIHTIRLHTDMMTKCNMLTAGQNKIKFKKKCCWLRLLIFPIILQTQRTKDIKKKKNQTAKRVNDNQVLHHLRLTNT